MIFERFEAKGLAHYSYLLGCRTYGVAVVVDPKRDVDTYLNFARQNNLKITHVLETHVHADYASGAKELSEISGAELSLSAYDAEETFRVKFPHNKLRDGDRVEVGTIFLRCLHTPGHTPEHIAFLVFDRSRSETVPAILLSGDFVFVGSVGRPDLLGAEASKTLLKKLFESVTEKLSVLPDSLEIHPAHGAGSFCGASIGGRPMSTLGYERVANPYLSSLMVYEEFRARVLANLPAQPPYYMRMKKLNSEGPRTLHFLPGRDPIAVNEFRNLIDTHVVVDLRDQKGFGAGHIAESFGIGVGSSLSPWAAWVLPYDTPLLLVANDESAVEEGVRSLVRVGFDDIKGYLMGGIEAWSKAGLPLKQTAQMAPSELFKELKTGCDIQVVDVRSEREVELGKIQGSINIECQQLSSKLDTLLQHHGRLAMVCGSGYRSTVAASILERAGLDNVINVAGGMQAWQRAGLPLSSTSN